jgi:hypothetical protein
MIALWIGAALAADPLPLRCAALLDERRAGAHAPGIEASDPCVGFRFDVAGRGVIDLPDPGLSRRLELARARVELGVWGVGPASARVAVLAVRSGGTTGYIGVDGEAIVPEVQIAEARVDGTKWGLSAAAGLVDDLWVIHSEDAWALRPVAPSVGEASGLQHRSDLGAWLAWTSPGDWVTTAVALTTGEGAMHRERNEGKDVATSITVRPLRTGAGALDVELYAREGSRGAGSARDHRVGGRVGWQGPWVSTGAEALAGWGLQADAALLPMQTSLWARTGPRLPAVGWARVDGGWASRDRPSSATVTWRAGAGPWIPWGKAPLRAASVVVGYEGSWLGTDARTIAGAAAAATRHSVFLQLSVRFDVGVPFSLSSTRGTFSP